jgi:hypothetical protein
MTEVQVVKRPLPPPPFYYVSLGRKKGNHFCIKAPLLALSLCSIWIYRKQEANDTLIKERKQQFEYERIRGMYYG